ncbi:MAG: response regulator [Bryobacteraceae bacterium]
MSRILLADDSPHAQRMGEAILRDEGFEVVSVTDGETALKRLADVDPDVVVAAASTPLRTGYQICDYIKTTPRHRHARVVLTTGALDSINEDEYHRVRADGALKKPFEASVMLAMIRPLVESAAEARSGTPVEEPPTEEPLANEPPVEEPRVEKLPPNSPDPPDAALAAAVAAHAVAVESSDDPPPVRVRTFRRDDAPPAEIDPERVRAAVAIAVDAVLPDLIDALTEKVLVALGHTPK